MRTYQNMRTQTAYLLKYAYSKCVPKRKVKVKLNRSKSWKVSLNLHCFWVATLRVVHFGILNLNTFFIIVITIMKLQQNIKKNQEIYYSNFNKNKNYLWKITSFKCWTISFWPFPIKIHWLSVKCFRSMILFWILSFSSWKVRSLLAETLS